ncbi:vanadium-dependent haloperoxidase [Allorhizocola rhizosphaerae]|uniref:vanadium-dependent haloperoxidase n=1 Tax=Allorhizocola rhizosphaerae TaxID=1872709 RepID=UPI001FE91D65|nr:vanadium-dependent haloperoxidase [Allorhizocola rhizosphaerae]
MKHPYRTRRSTRYVAAAAAAALMWTFAVTSMPAQGNSLPPSTNSVIIWNANAQTAIWDVAGESPWVQARSFAMAQTAVYDAVNAIAGKPYQPFLAAPRVSGYESTDAAVATAAYQVLVALFPAQQERLRAQYEDYINKIRNGRAKLDGIAVGTQAANTTIAARQNDGAFGNEPFTVGTEPGQWRPTPPTFGNAGQWAGHLKPFFIPGPSTFRTSGPPALTGDTYARDFNEIKVIGSANSTVRTPDQTDAAIWWHDRRLTQWEINRQLASSQRLNVLQSARMFAMVTLAAADANTACFNEKGTWNFWRPVTAVRLADTDGNPATEGDPNWTPLLITPPSPDYTSGHTCYSGATMNTLKYFFGRDDIAFGATSIASGTTRHYRSFSQALAEVIEARIWGGIHFRSADVEGAKIGRAVSDFLVKHHFHRLDATNPNAA